MKPLLFFFLPVLAMAQIDVPFERIRDAAKEPGNWLTYSRDYTGQLYSPLSQINAGNVARLHVAWMYQVNETDSFEVSDTSGARPGSSRTTRDNNWTRRWTSS